MPTIPNKDVLCGGCTCCREDFCFFGESVSTTSGDVEYEYGDCQEGAVGTYWEGQSICPCTQKE